MTRRRSRSKHEASIPSPASTADRKTRLAVPLLVPAVVLAYWNSLNAPFQFDDFAPLQNEVVQQSMPGVTPTPQLGLQVAGRPIVRASFALNYAWGGVNVTGYHAFNIAVHIVCTLLFFPLVRGTLLRWIAGDLRSSASSVAFWSAMIWVLHPLNTGAVTYISARSESLMAMWYLATLLAAMHAHDLLRELVARRPDYAPAHLALGDVYFRRSEFADAQQSYRRYLTYNPAHEGAQTNLGISAINTGQFAEGIQILQGVVDAQPQRASAHRNLAIALANADRLDEAIAHLEEAARLAPGDAATQELLEQLRKARSVDR